MRQIGVLPDEQDAQRFSDYLLTEGVSSRIDAEPEGWSIWIHNEEQVASSREAFEEFISEPSAAKYRTVAKEADRTRREEEKREKQFAKNTIDMRQRWSKHQGGAIPVTWAIIGLMAFATLATNFGFKPFAAKWLFMTPRVYQVTEFEARSLPEVRSGQVWRLITPSFMHGSIMHLLFGVWMFHYFGQMIERRQGALRLVALVLLLAISSNLAEYFIADIKDWGGGILQPSAAFLGMSGVIYGLFGYAWIQSRFVPTSGLFVSQQTVFILIAWLFICLLGFINRDSGGIANICHVAGLAVGMAVGYWPVWLRRLES